MKLIAVLGAILLAGLSVACATQANQDTKGEVVIPAPDYTLYYMEGGVMSRPISNGATIALGGTKSIEIHLDPYPPKSQTTLALYIFEESGGNPVTNAKVAVKYQMLYMDHGVSNVDAISKGDGHYSAALELGMVGEWLADVDLATEGERESVRLGMTLSP